MEIIDEAKQQPAVTDENRFQTRVGNQLALMVQYHIDNTDEKERKASDKAVLQQVDKFKLSLKNALQKKVEEALLNIEQGTETPE